MNIPFEAKYINIKWANSKNADTIIESKETIEIETLDNYTYELEAITYKNIDENISGQLAFHIIDNTLKKNPYFINAQNEKVKLLSVKDNITGKVWWIENGFWNKKTKYRSSVLCRTVGKTKVVFGDYTCIIQIGSLSFTYDELELYLKDFRSDLWGLIQREDSYVLGEAKTKKIKVAKIEWIEKIKKFIEFTDKILRNPKKELIREYKLQKASEVRPVQKTFIEIATKGIHSKYLTGQGYSESLNVSENRYVFALTNKLITLVRNEINIIDKRLQELDIELKDINTNIKKLSNSLELNEIEIDKKSIEDEIDILINQENKILKKAISTQKQRNVENLKTIYIYFDKSTEYGNLVQYWGKIKENYNDEWYKIKESNSLQLIFDKIIFINTLKLKCEYKITAYYGEDKKINKKNGGKIIKRHFEYISKMQVVNTPQLEKKKTLEQNGWKRILTPSEKSEFEYELKALKHKKELIEKQLDETIQVNKLLSPSFSKLKKIKQFFIKHKIKSKYYFSGSMTFIQNPNYQGTHKVYKQIIDKSGLNDELFESLEKLDSIGILDIPKVYERWCLLQIIKVLIDSFHFEPKDKNWKETLVKGVLVSKPQNITLKFQNINIKREITLTYEKILSNRKTPDYVLDIKGVNAKYHRFVLDAKFWEKLEISGIIDELYNQKNYSENSKNSVFILHPAKNIKSYYGECQKFDWDNKPPNHKYGAISLSPIQKDGKGSMYIKDLQKLIGMFLQYGMEDNQNIKIDGKIDPYPKEKIFCMICGGNNCKIEHKKTKRGGGWKHWITCNDCSHMTIYSYCGNCKSRLVKNGTSWTYHKTDINEPINVKCPYCGDML